VKPPRFEYVAPTSLEEALALRAEHGHDGAVLAGGQSLMPLLNLRMAHPAVVIDLGRVPGLAGIREWDGGIAIGAMTRQREAERSDLVGARTPLLAQALRLVGHSAIRNRGTVGGSLAHADGAAELPAVALALGAELVARSARGERTIAADDFFLGFLTTALEPDELLVEVRFPRPRPHAAIHEFARRHGDFAIVAAAVAVDLDGDVIREPRIVIGGVDEVPLRVEAAERVLDGAAPGGEAFAEAGRAAADAVEPSSDVHGSAEYRKELTDVLVRRALAEAIHTDRRGGDGA